MTCKCGNEKCLGAVLLHEKELINLDQIKADIRKEHGGNLIFDLQLSPSSGEIFTQFYDLHIRENESKCPDVQNIHNFTYEQLVEYSGEPSGTLGITMLEYLQKVSYCLRTRGTEEECEKCSKMTSLDYCVVDQPSMMLSIMMEMAELMRKDNERKADIKDISELLMPTHKGIIIRR